MVIVTTPGEAVDENGNSAVGWEDPDTGQARRQGKKQRWALPGLRTGYCLG